MQKNNNHNSYSSKSLAQNSIFNLLGYGIPLIFALILMPLLLKGLGEERFGILNLIWIVIGYFSFFDFGIGRAITQIIAEKIGKNQNEEIPGIFWTSLILMLFISCIGAIALLFFLQKFIYNFLNISAIYQIDTLHAFYILIVSIPIVTTSAGLRGVLEAYQKFGVINIIRTILGVCSFLFPLLCLMFTKSMIWIVASLALLRVIIWILYLLECIKINPQIKNQVGFQKNLVRPIFNLSGWMTVSNIIVPLTIYIDRFLIGAVISAAAISYYATPYEIITKLLLIPGALTGVLFPTFSANYLNNPEYTRRLVLKAVKFTFIIIYPLVVILITFSYEGMQLWLGSKFAENSALILQFLAAGALFNSIAFIPFTFLQGIKRPDIPAKVNLIEFPIYIAALWWAIKNKGINGAAFVWMVRMIIDSFILFWLTHKQISAYTNLKFNIKYVFILFFLLISLSPVLMIDAKLKFIAVVIILSVFSIICWKYFLQSEEKLFVKSRIKIFNS